MAQHDQVLDNAVGSAFRSDANDALAALFSNSSGATAPSVTVAYQLWADSSSGLFKQRNAANSDWITIGTLAEIGLGLLSRAGGAMSGVLQLVAGSDIASGSTVDLGSATGNDVTITHSTGTTAITGYGAASSLQKGTRIRCHASISGGTLTMTHNATSLILPGSGDITIANGDSWDMVKVSDSNAYWGVENYTRANGAPLIPYGWTIGSEVSTSGALPITVASGIPSWVTSIQILFDGVSLSGTDNILIQLNEVTSGYVSDASSGNIGIGTDGNTAGFMIRNSDAGQGYTGIVHLSKGTGNKWFLGYTLNATGNTQTQWGSGNIDLGATLTSLRINKSGTNTADGGVVTVKYQ